MMDLFKGALQNHIVKYMEELNKGVRSRQLIQTYNKIWNSYLSFAELISRRVFVYLDRYFLQG